MKNGQRLFIKAKRMADDDIYLNQDRYEKTKEFFKFISSLFNKKITSGFRLEILDVGCATGEFIYYLCKNFTQHKYTGIDISKEMIKQAKDKMPTEVWQRKNIFNKIHVPRKKYDIVLCVGVIQIFNDIKIPVANLLSYTKKGGSLYIAGNFNNYPIDTLMCYKDINKQHLGWQTGWNLFSTQTYNNFLSTKRSINWKWHDFKIPFAIKKTNDPMRTWTIFTKQNPFQLVNGASQILEMKVLEIKKLK